MPDSNSPGPSFKASLGYTLLGLAAVAAAVTGIMYFLVCRLGQPAAFWLIPIFGAAGGIVGSLMSGEKVGLLMWQGPTPAPLSDKDKRGDPPSLRPSNLQPGLVGDVIMGLAGAASAAFFLGGSLNLFPASGADPQSYLRIIAVSLIAGAFGKKVVEAAGAKLLAKEAKEEAQAANAKAEDAQEKTRTSMAAVYTRYAENNLKDDIGLDAALTFVKDAILLDPDYVQAYVVKAEVLKVRGEKALQQEERKAHDGFVKQAIEVLDRAIEIDPSSHDAYYDRARFKARIGASLEDVMVDLREALRLSPKLAVNADQDLYKDFRAKRSPFVSDEAKKKEFREKLLQGAQKAIDNDKRYLDAYVTKARMLKQENKYQEAYDALNEAFNLQGTAGADFSDQRYPAAYYNRACYAALLGRLESVLPDLRSALVLSPRLAQVAARDDDFKTVWQQPEFVKLLALYGVPQESATKGQ